MENNTIINQYKIIKETNSNEYYSIHLAQHTVTQIKVTIKQIEKKKIDQGSLELLKREVFLLNSMDHPFISTLYDFFEDDESYYICTEYIENGELCNYICDNQITEEQARLLFIELISAVDYLHSEKNILHKYLRPDNIMLDKNFNVRITEFDFYRSLCVYDPWINHKLGEERFASPEMCIEKPYSASSEVWVLGILLYSMITKMYPFAGEGIAPTIMKIMNENPKIPKKFSKKLTDLILKIFDKDPSKRITIEQIIEHPWLKEFKESQMILKDFEKIKSFKVLENQELDIEIVTEMNALGFKTNGILQELKENKINKRTAVYKMYKREKMKYDPFFVHLNDKKSKK